MLSTWRRQAAGALLAAMLGSACASSSAPPHTAAAPCGAHPAKAHDTAAPAAAALVPAPVAPVASTSAATPVTAAPSRPFVLAGTEVFDLAAKSNGRSYEIAVGAPYKSEPGKLHPTVYVLDGYWDFPLVNSMRGALQYDQAVPDLIVVGIGYSGLGSEAPQIGDLRASDDTPTPGKPAPDTGKPRPDFGKAPAFLRFISEELVPAIEARYPSDPAHRVLAGASFAGLFTLYALLERPDFFSGYIAMTPAVGWDDGWIGKRESEFKKTHPALPARLWLSVGGDEDPPKVKTATTFFKQIQASRYQDLALRTEVVEGERHGSMKHESYNRGLRFVLAPVAPKPSK